ncbi:MAG: hypothetical protein HY741_27940 [Chloroflexi bacterium]|nr:hypothetical protein [Chloroflexota bacterium]
MKKILILMLALSMFVFLRLPALADGPIQVKNTSYDVEIAKRITFHLNAASTADLTKIYLVVRFPGTVAAGSRLFPKFTPAPQVETDAIWNLDRDLVGVPGGYLPPGAQGTYSWHLEDAAGNVFDTPAAPFRVDDARFEWQTLENERFAVYWYKGGDAFGKKIFDRLNQTIDRIEQAIGAHIQSKIQVFIYADDLAFQSILSPGHSNAEFVGATPVHEFGVMLVKSPPEDLQFAIVAAPHELVHMVIDQELGAGLGQLTMPLWMNEGLASYYEYDPPKMEERYRTLLDDAIKNDTLLRLRNYANTRPSDYSEGLLMYGQGYSVVEFILKEYGQAKMTQIFAALKRGSADDAFMQVLGVNQDGLENLWRKQIGAPQRDYASQPTATVLARPTFALSSAETPGPRGSATPTKQSVAVANTPASAGATAIPPSSNTSNPGASTGLCGGVLGGLALAMFGAYGWRRRGKRGN